MRKNHLTRRQFLRTLTGTAGVALLGTRAFGLSASTPRSIAKKPNVIYIFADQWRAQATGYAGDKNAITPNLDVLVAQSVNFTTAVSGCPVCSPYRASLMTGQYPLTHGVFLNDVDFKTDVVTLALAYRAAGYQTAYIGKWHLAGLERSAFITREKRLGFEYWKAFNCNHHYNDSHYYQDKPVKKKWRGYDAIQQTRDAKKYIKKHADDEKPFLLVLSWGPPHAPYGTAPQKYKKLFANKQITLRPNVPEKSRQKATEALRGYYAHIAALDDCIGQIVKTLADNGIEDNTILVFTSDHGDMLYSQGHVKKQRPWDESILVPFLLRFPAVLGQKGKQIDTPIDAPDIMPTLLGLCKIPIPDTVEGRDFSPVLKGDEKPDDNPALITCPWPFGQFIRDPKGHPKFGPIWNSGKEYRGIRTKRYTYTRDLNGPWLLYDNKTDPCQLNNLINNPQYAELQKELDEILNEKLKQTRDEFLHGQNYIDKWGYEVDKIGNIPFKW